MITGEAVVDPAAPPADQLPGYVDKYRAEIARLGADPSGFAGEYSVPVRIRPVRLRAE